MLAFQPHNFSDLLGNSFFFPLRECICKFKWKPMRAELLCCRKLLQSHPALQLSYKTKKLSLSFDLWLWLWGFSLVSRWKCSFLPSCLLSMQDQLIGNISCFSWSGHLQVFDSHSSWLVSLRWLWVGKEGSFIFSAVGMAVCFMSICFSVVLPALDNWYNVSLHKTLKPWSLYGKPAPTGTLHSGQKNPQVLIYFWPWAFEWGDRINPVVFP